MQLQEVNFEKMVSELAKDGHAIIDGLTFESAHLWHMATGLAGEVGELIENHILQGSYENRIEELGDIEFYYEGVRAVFDLDKQTSSYNVPDTLDRELLKLSVASNSLLDAVKKYAIYEKPLNRLQLINSMFEIRNGLTNIYYTFSIERSIVIDANIKKLSVRYSAGKFTNEDAQNRADKA